MSAPIPDKAERNRVEPRPRYFPFIEIPAVIITIVCVWLAGKGHIANWPVGIVGALLYIYIFRVARLYSDVLLNIYFVITSLYGWYYWLHGGADQAPAVITRLSPHAAIGWTAVTLAGIALIGSLMKRYSRAAFPYTDAATTMLSIVAQILLTRMILESWCLWILADIIDTVLYFRRKLYWTALLYATLLGIAIRSLLEWLGAAP